MDKSEPNANKRGFFESKPQTISEPHVDNSTPQGAEVQNSMAVDERTGRKSPLVIALANQKGGVAKTTSAVSLGGALASRSNEVLLVDLDSQANLTLALGKDPARVRGSITDVLFHSATLLSVSRETSIPGLDLVPANSGMDLAERFLPVRKDYETILKRIIEKELRPRDQKMAEIEERDSASFDRNFPIIEYDYIILDCPPFMGAVTLNALIAADLLIIPTQPEYFSAHALRTMMTTIRQVRLQQNSDLVYRILITMLDRRNRIHRQIRDQIQKSFGEGVFTTIIEVDTKLRESAIEGKPIHYHNAHTRSALQYDALAQEIIEYALSQHPPPEELVDPQSDSKKIESQDLASGSKEGIKTSGRAKTRAGSQAEKRLEDLFSGLFDDMPVENLEEVDESVSAGLPDENLKDIGDWFPIEEQSQEIHPEPFDPRKILPKEPVQPAEEPNPLVDWEPLDISLPSVKLKETELSPTPLTKVLKEPQETAEEWIPDSSIQSARESETLSPAMLLEMVDRNPGRRWNEEELLLVEQVAGQLTLALENAQLFEQTQQARDALQISVRYQKSVAEAVSTLSERGFSAISEVLQVLGEAAQVSRAYFIETQVDYHGPYWRIVSEWHTPGVSSHLTDPDLRRLSGDWLKSWIDRLGREGHLTADRSSPSFEGGKLVEALHAQSVLQFLVPGLHDTPGCIGFEQTDYVRTWSSEEIAALKTAASALANTIVRENLFNQLQVNLTETEAQYQASAQINSANNTEEILTILRQFTILGHINAASVIISLFDHAWTRSEKPTWLVPAASWSFHTLGGFLFEKTALREWENAETLLSPDRPTIVIDIGSDPRFDGAPRSLFTESLGAKSLLSVPLNVSGRWIGQIIALYSQTTGFTERDIRRLVSLSGQAAVAVESLRLLEETRQRNEELLAMNQVTSAVSRTLELDQVLNEILQRVLEVTGFDGGLISYVHHETHQLTLAVHHDLPPVLTTRFHEDGLGGTPCEMVFQTGLTLHFSDLAKISEGIAKLRDPLPADWPDTRITKAFSGLKAMGFQAYLGVPLMVKGAPLGTVCMFSRSPKDLDPSRIALAQAIGQQVGVAVDNARMFRNTQAALGETEALYQASSELTSIQSYDDILSSLRRHTLLGKSDRLISIALFNHPWFIKDEQHHQTGRLPSDIEIRKPEWLIPFAQWSQLPPDIKLVQVELEHSPGWSAVSQHGLTVIEEVSSDPRLEEDIRKLFKERFQARSVLWVPLFVGSLWIGVIFAAFGEELKMDETQARRLTTLAGQAAIAIQNLRLLDESRRRASQLQTAAEIARDTSSTLALDNLLHRTVRLFIERFGYYHASIFLIDEESNEAVVRESTGSAGEEMKRTGHRLEVGSRSVVGQVTAEGKSLLLNDVTTLEAQSIHHPNPLLPSTRAELGIPLKIGERVIGAFNVQSDVANSFSEDDVSVLQILADQVAVAVDNARSYELAQKAVEEIREADRLKTQFLANMSHELRTPLNSIIGFSRVILKGIDGPINEQQTQDLTAIFTSGQHLLGLINDVLDVSRIEAGKMELSFEENVNLADIIHGVMSTTIGLVKDKPIALQQHIDPNLPLITADAMKIRQVLINLLSNAAKFTEQGSITVEAYPQSGPEGEPQVVVRVTDSGPGILPKDQDKLFLPFSQVDGSLTRKTGGSGLGLSICNHLVRMHNGQIGLETETGKGSTFFFILPVNQPEVLEETEPTGMLSPELAPISDGIGLPDVSKERDQVLEADQRPEAPSFKGTGALSGGPLPSTKSRLILSIDQDSKVIDLYRRYLAGSACTMIALTRLEQAVTVARGVQPFAITLDIGMTSSPGKNRTSPLSPALGLLSAKGTVDGFKVLKDLKADPATRHIPVIICSMAALEDKAREAGADDYLLKPILEEDLVQAIKRLEKK